MAMEWASDLSTRSKSRRVEVQRIEWISELAMSWVV